ncbi:phosphoethanolamine--lipid A transferase [Shewanella baltica]|uniref:phosphoethanolamine transferase n=1 Tax=Shewanella baltica TaxID=62322 RepID=UPI00217F100C|nr:phosphoethanolamine--lipid A transferase [Shewanella baltica]MCS6125994.1 phosphoethanolamine--lipid A transferase [Shewanella baltica]MCS6138644.1 phosphoethanolamine--lipid A transferase [Shewanella baltica]MCS6144512.1 phosphoethanolamine--lipid A transferase [Shewanella baltica]MCS6169040.1 phosphoethanolamine--lipid A transferase [Shewanella baltica]MCS6185986.1 phosphoethanolamine--lipid A transferase [Shewanella baltica]
MLARFKTLSVNRFTFITALFYVCIFNIPLFGIIKKGIEKQPDVDPIFIATMPLFLAFALSFVFSLFTVKYLVKPFFIILTLLSSSVFFAAYQYNVVFDYGMIENTFQTNHAEALMYVNFASIMNMLLTGILPAYLIYKADIQYQPFFKELLHKVLFMLAMLAGLGIIAFFYFQDYAAFGRNNDELKRYIVPTYFIGAASKYINVHYLQTPIEYQQLGLDAKNVSANPNGKPNLLVLVVGETARSMSYQYYGYDKPTNAHTQDQGLIVFKDTSSCGTATAVSLPCMFSRMGREDYDSRRAYAQDTAVDVLNHGGIKVQWFDNDSGCKGVCDQVENISIDLNSDPELCTGQYCFDQVLLNKLDETLATAERKDTVIVLHVIGSHGPTYFLRYPPEHRKFTPDCQRSDIQNCSPDELMNTYDNTILYTDYIISEVVKKLQDQQDKFDPAMLYLSDHGESLGEKGMYLHGAPYSIAPIEQTSIPMLAWVSEDFSKDNHLDMACLAEHAAKGGFSHDNLFDSLLGLMNVKTEVYQPKLDIFASCRG